MDGTRSMGSRSSSRHGPASSALFTGPVRRWKKAWAPISSPTPSSSSKLFLYKWVPLPPGIKDETSEEPTIQISRYLPVSIALAQRKDASKRALEEDDTSPVKPSGKLLCEVAGQYEASAGVQINDTIFMESSRCLDVKEKETTQEKLVVRDLNFSAGPDMSVDVELQA